MDSIRPITDLKNHTAEMVDDVEESGRTIVITQHGKARAVLMDVAVYERWRKSLALLKLLAHSEADVQAGRLLSEEETFARAEAKVPKKRRK
jgi:prevent-host-death family protein